MFEKTKLKTLNQIYNVNFDHLNFFVEPIDLDWMKDEKLK